jgi:hypothetical protein
VLRGTEPGLAYEADWVRLVNLAYAFVVGVVGLPTFSLRLVGAYFGCQAAYSFFICIQLYVLTCM